MLFEDSSDSEEGGGIRINRQFAENFERRKRRQELAKAREAGLLDAYGNVIEDSDASTSESEDEAAELLKPETELSILKTINAIRSKNPKIYESSHKWFEDEEGEAQGSASSGDGRRKKVTAKDVIAQQVTAAMQEGKDTAFDEDDVGHGNRDEAPVNMYDAEQAKIREEFLKTAEDRAEAAGNSDSDGDDDFLQVKPHSDSRHASIPALLEDDAVSSGLEPQEKESIKRYIHGPAQDDAERFLKDFIVHRRWEAKNDDIPETAEEEEEEEAELEKQDEFEAAYNFRFEEEGGGAIVTHARHVEDSLRRKTEKRKRQRQLLKERQRQEQEERERELRRLINLKREELRDQLKQVEDVAGSNIDYNSLDLDGEWDPDSFDAAMSKIFNDEYYEEADEDLPVSPSKAQESADDAKEEGNNDEDDNDDDVTAFMSGERRPSWAGPVDGSDIADISDSKVAAMRKALAAKTEEQIAQLHYEDVVGGMKTRFHYRAVPKSDFGVDTATTLLLDDRELNEFVSLKKLAPYRDSEWYVPSKKRRKALKAFAEKTTKEIQRLPEQVKTLLEEEARLLKEKESAGKKKKLKAIQRERKRLVEAAAAALEGQAGGSAPSAPDMKIVEYDEYMKEAQGEKAEKKKTRRSKKRKLTQQGPEGAEADGAATKERKEDKQGKPAQDKPQKPKKTVDLGGVEITKGRLRSYAGPGLKKKSNESASKLMDGSSKKKKRRAKKKNKDKSKE